MKKIMMNSKANETFCMLTRDINRLHKQDYFYTLPNPIAAIAAGMRTFALSVNYQAKDFFINHARSLSVIFSEMIKVGEELTFPRINSDKNLDHILSGTNINHTQVLGSKFKPSIISSKQIHTPTIFGNKIVLPINYALFKEFANNIDSSDDLASRFLFAIAYSSGALQNNMQNPITSLEKALAQKMKKNIVPVYEKIDISIPKGVKEINVFNPLTYNVWIEKSKKDKRGYVAFVNCHQKNEDLFKAKYNIKAIPEKIVLINSKPLNYLFN